MNKIFYLIFLPLFISCVEKNNINEGYKKKTIENKYSILIPESLNKTTGLNRHTTFEYENLNDDFYVIIMDELKENFHNAVMSKRYNVTPDIKGYYQVIKKHFKEETNITNFQVFDEIFELDEVQKKITFTLTGTGKEDNYSIFYRYSIIESKTSYYQIMSWTNQKNSKNVIDKMNTMINSFQIEEN